MIPKIHPNAIEPIVALAAIDCVADKLSYVPAPTVLFLNTLWNYGRRPPIVAEANLCPEEALQLGWQKAIYDPGMAYLLGEMRMTDRPETSLCWFHDAVYLTALQVFRLFESTEYAQLPEEYLSSAPSDVVEANGLEDFIFACGMALDKFDDFAAHFTIARKRFEEELQAAETSRWPPFNGITRAAAEAWFV